MNKDPKPTLDDLLKRDKESGKLDELTKQKESTSVDQEWVILAELGLYFGWDAVVSARNNNLTMGDMNKLLIGARKLSVQKRYNEVIDMYTALAGSQSKDGVKAVKSHLRELRKQIGQ